MTMTMTERALPAIGVGVQPRPATGVVPRLKPHPAAREAAGPPVARRDTILFTPARVGLLMGASAAVYAVTLAGVSVLQAQADAAAVTAGAPWQEAVAEARAANDALEARIQATDARIRAMIGEYGAMGADVTDFQDRLDELATLVAEVRGSAAALPARIKLPTVSARGAVAGGGGGSAPKTSGTSGASGG